MSEKYMDQFKITELFDQNKHQEIHMATNRLDADVVAVINTIKKTSGLDENFLYQAQQGLKGLIHSEQTSEAITLVTQHCNGEPLSDWLKHTPDLNDEVLSTLTQSYLEHIALYDHFSPYFSAMLADASQIVIQKGQLCMSEMIFMDEQLTDFSIPSTGFSGVREKVKEVLSMIIAAQNQPLSRFTLAATSFIESKLNEANSFAEIQSLWHTEQQDDLEKTRQLTTPIVPPESENEILIELDALREKKPVAPRQMGLLILAALVIVSIAGIFLASHFKSKTAPVASYTWVKQADGVLKFTNTSKTLGENNSIMTSEWKIFSDNKEIYTCSSFNMAIGLKTSGQYKVTLRVMDKNKLWSKPYSETLNYEAVKLVPLKDSGLSDSTETLDKFKITFNTPNIFEDDKVFNTGNKSLRLELGERGKASLTLHELNTPTNYVISFWIKTSRLGQFDVHFNGTKGGHTAFNELVTLNPESTEAWQMVELRISGKDIDALTLTLNGSGNVWLDDFQIGEIK